MNTVITIGRQFGSGGRELGRRLAEELGLAYYDREIVTAIAKSTSFSEEYVTEVTEQCPNLYPITVGQSFHLPYGADYQLGQLRTVYKAQSDLLRSFAEKSGCVIIGRCADYILRDYQPYRIFVYADTDARVARCMAHLREDEAGTTEKAMAKKIAKLDRERARYYEYYTRNKWGDRANYDLCINTTNFVVKDIVPHIAKMFK